MYLINWVFAVFHPKSFWFMHVHWKDSANVNNVIFNGIMHSQPKKENKWLIFPNSWNKLKHATVWSKPTEGCGGNVKQSP